MSQIFIVKSVIPRVYFPQTVVYLACFHVHKLMSKFRHL